MSWLGNIWFRCRCAHYILSCIDGCVWAMGPVFVCLALCLITGIGAMLFVAVPAFYFDNKWTVLSTLHYLFAVYVVGSTYFNYGMTILTPPGSPSAEDEEAVLQAEEDQWEPGTSRLGGDSARVRARGCRRLGTRGQRRKWAEDGGGMGELLRQSIARSIARACARGPCR